MRLQRAVLYHFLPNAAVAIAYLALAFVAPRFGLPRVAALLASFAFVGIPIQLAMLRRWPVRYNVRRPLWQHVAGALGLIAIVALLLRVPLGHISEYLARNVFWFIPPDDDFGNASRAVILVVLIAQVLIDGIVNPIVEERYFRGMLLPHLEPLGLAAPVVNTALFALAHFWQPYNAVSIFVYVLPLTLFTWWRKNYYAQAFVHCFANSFGAVMALIAFVKHG